MQTSGKQNQRKFLVSKRFDVSKFDTPEYHWPFYDAYNSSIPCQQAITQYTNSIQGENLDKYLGMAKSFTVPLTIDQLIVQLPAPFNKLLPYQKDDGSFHDLVGVLQSLKLSKEVRFLMPRAQNSQQLATALAIAAMRQRIDLFDDLQFAHDQAVKHVHNGLVIEARELILEYTLADEEYSSEYAEEILSQNAPKPFVPPPIRAGVSNGEPILPPIESSRQYVSNIDLGKVAALEKRIASMGVDLMPKILELDSLVAELKVCLTRCISIFLGTESLIEKNAAFDELTYRLGEGFPAREGFQDWRRFGVPGIRPLIIDILNRIHNISEVRMEQEEYRTEAPSLAKRHLDRTLHFSHGNRGRWSFHYNGQDTVHKIIHCLDFLRSCREISFWYGRKYWFMTNPLQLPMNMVDCRSLLELSTRIDEELKRKPHYRKVVKEQHTEDEDGISYDEQQYFSGWGLKVDSVCSRLTQWNWPVLPSFRKVEDARQFHVALIVLFGAGGEEIETTVAYETEFINMVKAGRGDHLMIGNTGMKPNRQLCLPLESEISDGTLRVLKNLDIGPEVKGKKKKKLVPVARR